MYNSNRNMTYISIEHRTNKRMLYVSSSGRFRSRIKFDWLGFDFHLKFGIVIVVVTISRNLPTKYNIKCILTVAAQTRFFSETI